MAVEKLKIFITGHNGFIGKKLIHFLSNNNKFIIIKYEDDLLNEALLDSFFNLNKPDIIIHLAGVFSSDFDLLLEKNLKITQNIAFLSKKYRVKKIIYSSSGAVYGSYKDSAFIESDLLFPIDFYGLSKKMAEDLLQLYQRNEYFSLIILRFPNVYSSHGEGHGVVSKFLEQIKKEKQVIIDGDGEQRRDFLHVDDACQAITKVINYEKSDIFNISSNVNLSLNELVEVLKRKYLFKTKYISAEIKLTNLNLEYKKSTTKLNYKPTFNTINI